MIYKFTGIIALVFLLILFFIDSKDINPVSGSISAKQILVLFNAKLRPVDIYDIPELSPRVFFKSKALIDKIKASVPVAQPTEYFTLANLENFFSNFSTFFPSIKSPFLTVDKRDLLILIVHF